MKQALRRTNFTLGCEDEIFQNEAGRNVSVEYCKDHPRVSAADLPGRERRIQVSAVYLQTGGLHCGFQLSLPSRSLI